MSIKDIFNKLKNIFKKQKRLPEAIEEVRNDDEVKKSFVDKLQEETKLQVQKEENKKNLMDLADMIQADEREAIQTLPSNSLQSLGIKRGIDVNEKLLKYATRLVKAAYEGENQKPWSEKKDNVKMKFNYGYARFWGHEEICGVELLNQDTLDSLLSSYRTYCLAHYDYDISNPPSNKQEYSEKLKQAIERNEVEVQTFGNIKIQKDKLQEILDNNYRYTSTKANCINRIYNKISSSIEKLEIAEDGSKITYNGHGYDYYNVANSIISEQNTSAEIMSNGTIELNDNLLTITEQSDTYYANVTSGKWIKGENDEALEYKGDKKFYKTTITGGDTKFNANSIAEDIKAGRIEFDKIKTSEVKDNNGNTIYIDSDKEKNKAYHVKIHDTKNTISQDNVYASIEEGQKATDMYLEQIDEEQKAI